MAFTRHSVLRLLAAPRPDRTASSAFGHPASPAREHLDRIPRAVVVGFESALESRTETELVHRIDLLDPALTGFGYEGATMAWTILDATTGGTRTRSLLRGPARNHLFLAYIGIGFAMNRLPRVLWRRVLPDLDIPPYHPTLSWLAVDGYGFDLAYFTPATYVDATRRPPVWPWLGSPGYFHRAVDQGIGRALWFVEGADVGRTAATVTRFAPGRRADLWSGVGLAATFAGPSDDVEYGALVDAAAEHAPQLGVGSVLAAKARVAAGHVPSYTRQAVQALAGHTPEDAAALADGTAVTTGTPEIPAYDRWRGRIAEVVTTTSTTP